LLIGERESDCSTQSIAPAPGSAAGEYSLPDWRQFRLAIAERFVLPALLADCTGTSIVSAVFRGRGTGTSFGRDISGSSMTVEQLIADPHELVDAMGTHIGQNKVAIMNKKLDLSLDWANEQAGLEHEMKSHYRFGGGTIASY
jgi:hypothetical protein